MADLQSEINILDKMLNGPLFLEKFPIIKRVHVYESQKNDIEVVLVPRDENDVHFWGFLMEMKLFIHKLSKVAGVTFFVRIHP